jgi:hypothetical protein
LELERRLDSTPDRTSPALLLLNRNLYKWRTTSIVWCVCSDFHQWRVFIGPWGSSTDLAKVVTLQVAAGRPIHVSGWPGGTASTTFLYRLGHPLLVWTRVHEAMGQTNLRPGWPAGRPLGPFSLGFGPLSPRVK